jgi:hypothetical protein
MFSTIRPIDQPQRFLLFNPMPDTEKPHSRMHRRRFRGLGQVIGWGVSAAFAVGILVIVSEQEADVSLTLPFVKAAPAHESEAQMPARPAIKTPPNEAKADAEIKQLAAAVRQLTAGNERLKAQIASLERHLNDVTGSISRRAATAAPAPTTEASIPPMLPKFAAIARPPNKTANMIEPLAMPAAQATPAAWPAPDERKAESKPIRTEAEPKSVANVATPVLSPVPLPRVRPIRTALAAARPRPVAPPGPALGVDIGGAMTVERLNEQWTMVKANFGPALVGLRPIIGRDHHFGHMPYRLLIGPVTGINAALRLCANLIPEGLKCRPARFEGEQLAQH